MVPLDLRLFVDNGNRRRAIPIKQARLFLDITLMDESREVFCARAASPDIFR